MTARVAYLLTHYPKLAQTFLRREIEAVEDEGIAVFPIAINPPAPHETVADADRREAQRTFYVKAQSRRAVARAVARAFGRDPRVALPVARAAERFAKTDLRAVAWRGFHMVEAAVVWDHCRNNGIRHIHAQFGGTPATVAMLAAQIGCQIDGPGSWTWSYTVHLTLHELVNEKESGLADKTAGAAFVVGISDYTTAQLMRVAHPRDWPKIHTVRCGIDVDQFAFRPPAAATGRAPVVLTVGRLSVEKGHTVLLEAIRLLRGRGVEMHAVFVGDGPLRRELADRVRAMGLGDRVTLAGEVEPPTVAAMLRDADVFCLPSFAEGLPVSIMEAMAVGVPVVSTYIGGIPELVEDGVTGYCVPAGRADMLADALVRATDPAGNRADVVRRARARVVEQHTLQRNVVAMRDLLLGARPAS